MSHPPVATRQFADHVDQLKCNDGVRFSHEYESIEPGQQFTWDASSLDVNKNKNRYANVIAYDHSRVVLQSLDGVVGSDYINANFMDGYRQQNAYIATQVPLLSLPPPLSLSLSLRSVQRGPALRYSLDLQKRIRNRFALNVEVSATKYQWIYRYFLQCIV